MSPEPVITFFAPGEPVPQGSKRVWLNRKTNRPMMTEAAGVRHASWRREVTAAAVEARDASGITDPLAVALTTSVTFHLLRPAHHYGTGRNIRVLKSSAPAYPHNPPDVDKLVRAVFDAITDARVWLDDAQVVSLTTRKRWADRFTGSQGVEVRIGIMPEPLEPAVPGVGLGL